MEWKYVIWIRETWVDRVLPNTWTSCSPLLNLVWCCDAVPEHLTWESYPERWSQFNSGLTHDWSHFPEFVQSDPGALGDMDALASGLLMSALPLCCDLGLRGLHLTLQHTRASLLEWGPYADMSQSAEIIDNLDA